MMKDPFNDVWESLQMHRNDFWCIWTDPGQFQEIMRSHSETTSPHSKWPLQNQIFCAGAQCFMSHLNKTWCEALSSRSRALRVSPWSDGQMSQIPCLDGTFGWRLLHEGVLDHLISNSWIYNDHSGTFASWFRWQGLIVSLIPGCIGAFRMMRIMKNWCSQKWWRIILMMSGNH